MSPDRWANMALYAMGLAIALYGDHPAGGIVIGLMASALRISHAIENQGKNKP